MCCCLIVCWCDECENKKQQKQCGFLCGCFYFILFYFDWDDPIGEGTQYPCWVMVTTLKILQITCDFLVMCQTHLAIVLWLFVCFYLFFFVWCLWVFVWSCCSASELHESMPSELICRDDSRGRELFFWGNICSSWVQSNSVHFLIFCFVCEWLLCFLIDFVLSVWFYPCFGLLSVGCCMLVLTVVIWARVQCYASDPSVSWVGMVPERWWVSPYCQMFVRTLWGLSGWTTNF